MRDIDWVQRAASALPGWFLLGVAFVIGGCDQTHFQSPPSSAMRACDQSFVGTWMLIDAGPPSASCEDHELCEVFVIGENCSNPHFASSDQGTQAERGELEKATEIGFADLSGRKLLSMSIDLDSGVWPRAYGYYRYEVVGDTIRLYDVDSERVAQLIDSKAIVGLTQRTVHTHPSGEIRAGTVTITNYVSGDARAMARVALLPKVFRDVPAVVLKRVGADSIVRPSAANPAP